MQKMHLMVSIFILIYVCSGVSYGDDIHQTDAQIVEEMILKIKKLGMYEDREQLNINKIVKAQWSNSASVVIAPLDTNAVYEKYVYLIFHYIYESYGRGGRKSCIIEEFMEQINKKRSKRIPLINFIQKDLVATFEYADGDKVVFDAYYNEIKYYGNVKCKKFNK
jgi:hypothetical protein